MSPGGWILYYEVADFVGTATMADSRTIFTMD